MFSIFKNNSTEQDVVLQELSEGQLAQVAGGRARNDHDWDDRKKVHHHRHHHHHHMMMRNDHDWDDRKTWNTTPMTTKNTFTGHF